MIRAYKYRIYPTDQQKALIEKTFGVCRLIYNLALETRITAWQSARKNLSSYDLQYQLKGLKNEYEWMKEIDSQSIKAEIVKMDTAFRQFYKGGGFPKFKSKKGKQSFHCPNGTRKIDWNMRTLELPKIKNLSIAISRKFEGKIKTITISKSPTNKYFASVLVNENKELPHKPPIISASAIGIDLGIKAFAVSSTGKIYEANRFLKNSLSRLRCLQHRASRKKKGSKNRKKAKLCVAKLHEQIKNQRTDFMHKISTELTRDNQVGSLVIEDLHVCGLLKNNKLSLSIQDASWGEFIRQLKYKADWYGKNLIVIDRFAPSSKRCSECGTINNELTLADREWTCKCGTRHDRDLNAAKNIKFFGLNTPVGSREGPAESRRLRRAKKQEIDNANFKTLK